MFGHPKGLRTLFFTEFWERFSFYGIRTLLVLYMTAGLENGGLGFPIAKATTIYGIYLMMVYLVALPGGYIADRFWGQRKSITVGGIFIALGNFCLVAHDISFFIMGLALITIGTGLLKPNITVMVGGLYKQNDSRRDGGFTIFYMGINLGAMIAPLLTGYIAQSTGFITLIRSMGITIHSGWNWAFFMAGIGMIFGLVQFNVSAVKRFGQIGKFVPKVKSAGSDATVKPKQEFTVGEKKRLKVIAILFFFNILFWSAFEQAGSSLNLFARDFTRNIMFGYTFPSSWFQSVNAVFILAFAPVFAWLWIRLARKKKEPSGPAKFAFGLLGVGLGFWLLVFGANIAASQGIRVSPLWLTGVYLLHTLGELCLSPVGLSLMTKLAPKRIAAFVMGIWFTSIGLGNGLGGWIAGFYNTNDGGALKYMLGGIGLYTTVAAVILAFLVKPMKALIGNQSTEVPPEPAPVKKPVTGKRTLSPGHAG
ncbi:MAG: peptide MFS transporter [bacterium]|nr:peptide MFS transporter [bacterium]